MFIVISTLTNIRIYEFRESEKVPDRQRDFKSSLSRVNIEEHSFEMLCLFQLQSSDVWILVCLMFVFIILLECCLVEQISSSEIEFEERRRRRETDLRRKVDLVRYVQDFRVSEFIPTIGLNETSFRWEITELNLCI